jgi:hypothetical protein
MNLARGLNLARRLNRPQLRRPSPPVGPVAVGLLLALVLAAASPAGALLTTGETPFDYGANGVCGPATTAEGSIFWRFAEPADPDHLRLASFRYGFSLGVLEWPSRAVVGHGEDKPYREAVYSTIQAPLFVDFYFPVDCADGSTDSLACWGWVESSGRFVMAACSPAVEDTLGATRDPPDEAGP